MGSTRHHCTDRRVTESRAEHRILANEALKSSQTPIESTRSFIRQPFRHKTTRKKCIPPRLSIANRKTKPFTVAGKINATSLENILHKQPQIVNRKRKTKLTSFLVRTHTVESPPDVSLCHFICFVRCYYLGAAWPSCVAFFLPATVLGECVL